MDFNIGGFMEEETDVQSDLVIIEYSCTNEEENEKINQENDD